MNILLPRPARPHRYRSRQRTSITRQINATLAQAIEAMQAGEFERAIRLAQSMVLLAPPRSFLRVEVLNTLGAAQMMSQAYADAYLTFSEAVQILPQDPYLWYNRGFASRYTMRFGQALLDFDQAVQLEGDTPAAAQYREAQQQAAYLAQRYLEMRKPGFTLEQLVQQEDLFQQAVQAMEADQWAQAEEQLRQVIWMSDNLPQPWCNLGVCMMVQGNVAGAERALVRALELKPDYEHARANLAVLRAMQQEGGPN
ncbi:MAG: hypothetical protein HC911_12395 [Chloroflexaceae bacterium]|nr:hypothetical protein [Chloroflexaceae bacterium]